MFRILIGLFMNLILILGLAWYGCFACFKVHVNSCLNRYKRDCSKVYVKEERKNVNMKNQAKLQSAVDI